jgi:hypothetical protein
VCLSRPPVAKDAQARLSARSSSPVIGAVTGGQTAHPVSSVQAEAEPRQRFTGTSSLHVSSASIRGALSTGDINMPLREHRQHFLATETSPCSDSRHRSPARAATPGLLPYVVLSGEHRVVWLHPSTIGVGCRTPVVGG